jgi:hypothetical protein
MSLMPVACAARAHLVTVDGGHMVRYTHPAAIAAVSGVVRMSVRVHAHRDGRSRSHA